MTTHTFYTGETCELTWSFEDGEHIVYCLPKIAGAPVYGFGVTEEEAINDLDRAYKDLQDFAES